MQRSSLQLQITGVLLVALTTTALGQLSYGSSPGIPLTRHVTGSVLDTAGAPVPLVDVRLSARSGWHEALQTNAGGHFDFIAVPAGPVQFDARRLGYRPVTRLLTVSSAGESDSVRIVLATIAVALAGIQVNDAPPEEDRSLAAFYARRRTNNFGHYLDRGQIEATHAQRPSDALRSVPGILVRPSARLIGNIIRIRNCRPTVWIDGLRVAGAELDEVANLADIAAIEVYKSLAGLPQEFIDRTNPCGGILIWSRSH